MTMMWMIAAALAAAQAAPAGHPAHHAAAAQHPEEAAVKEVLTRYKAAIEKLDASGTEALFTPDSTIFETGGVEGSYAQYLARHLGPELGHVKSFAFSDYKVEVRFEGPVALANETYNYRIELNDGKIVERRGVATSVLKKVGGTWKIVSMHNSARPPRKP